MRISDFFLKALLRLALDLVGLSQHELTEINTLLDDSDELFVPKKHFPPQHYDEYTHPESIIQVSKLDDVFVFVVLQMRAWVVISFWHSFVPVRTILARRRPALASSSLPTLVLAPDDDVSSNQECGADPPERGQVFREDHKAEYGRDEEVGRGVHDGHLCRRVAPSQRFCEEGPHHSVESQVEPEKDLVCTVSMAL